MCMVTSHSRRIKRDQLMPTQLLGTLSDVLGTELKGGLDVEGPTPTTDIILCIDRGVSFSIVIKEWRSLTGLEPRQCTEATPLRESSAQLSAPSPAGVLHP